MNLLNNSNLVSPILQINTKMLSCKDHTATKGQTRIQAQSVLLIVYDFSC